MQTCPKYDDDNWPPETLAKSPEEPDRKLVEMCIRKRDKWVDVAMKMVSRLTRESKELTRHCYICTRYAQSAVDQVWGLSLYY